MPHCTFSVAIRKQHCDCFFGGRFCLFRMALRIFFGIIRKVTIFYRLDFNLSSFYFANYFFWKIVSQRCCVWRLESAANGGIKRAGGPSTLDEFLF